MPRIIWFLPAPAPKGRKPNAHLEDAVLCGTQNFSCRRCRATYQRSELSFLYRKSWQTYKCTCGIFMRVPPVTA